MRRIFVSGVIACLAAACDGSGDSPASDGGTSGGSSGGAATAGAGSGGSSSGSGRGADGSAASAGSASDASSPNDAGSQGKDAAAGDAGSVVTCDPREILCKAAETPCPAGQVHQVVEHCYGPCVEITECPCDGPEACPHSEEFTCWNNTGHCNYYGP